MLAVVYLVFNEGYGGRVDLAAEAIRLGTALAELMPDEPEVHGLNALMLLDDARRDARFADGELVLFAEQDRSRRNYWAGGALGPDPEHWMATAKSIRGSWWPAWTAWLGKHAGPKVPARAALGNESYKTIEPAPGRYVRVKAQ